MPACTPVTIGRVSQPEGDPPGATDEQLSRFLDGLRDHFATYRPQGSAAWNFEAAFQRLEETWGRTFHADRAVRAHDEGTGAVPEPPAGSRSKRMAGRLGMARAEPSVPKAVEFDRAEEGFDAALEALRFMAARVERLERDAAVRRRPVDGLAWFEPDDVVPLHAARVADAVRGDGISGGVLHVECGGGELLVRLGQAGVEARGADPRGALALEAAGRGVTAEESEALDALAASAPGSLRAVVLSGVVDREPLPQLLALLDGALRALGAGGLLVVVSRGPGSVGGWAAVARDLLPGRPLHAETWELLLQRAGCTEVARLSDGPDGAYAVSARKA